MEVGMIVTDLDRTLLHTDKTISEYTAEVLYRCQKLGIKVVFATARPKRTVTQFLEGIPVDSLILHNGAVIYAENVLLGNFGIDPKLRDQILLSISRDYPDVALSVEVDDVFYANFDVSTIWNYTQAVMTDFTDLPDKPADKIIVGVSSFEDIERFSKYISDDLYFEMSDGQLGLIMNRKATKWEAIRIVADHFNVSADKIVAFGDDYNDLGMLRNCGTGVAVDNALDEIKTVADSICESNDNDGVAKWIDKHIL